jgi:hypothetical protein
MPKNNLHSFPGFLKKREGIFNEPSLLYHNDNKSLAILQAVLYDLPDV